MQIDIAGIGQIKTLQPLEWSPPPGDPFDNLERRLGSFFVQKGSCTSAYNGTTDPRVRWGLDHYWEPASP